MDNNGGKAQSVFEHNVVKIGTPLLGVLLLSIVGWLFQTVLELDENMQKHSICLSIFMRQRKILDNKWKK